MKLSRYLALSTLALGAFLLQPAYANSSEASSEAPTAEQVLGTLSEGNARFVAEKSEHPNRGARRRLLTARDGQKPYVTILACADSREAPELIFDAGIGDLFVIRVAGNVIDSDITASIEYGVAHLSTPVMLVMGHTKCGAVGACVDNAKVHGSLPHLLAHINPAEKIAREKHPGARQDEIVKMTVIENIWVSISDLLKASPEIRQMALEGKVRVLGALYDIESGEVKILGQHPDEKELLMQSSSEEHSTH